MIISPLSFTRYCNIGRGIALATIDDIIGVVVFFTAISIYKWLVRICAAIANLIPEQMLSEMLKLYNPVLNLSLVIVIVNLGMPLDYRLITGAGLFTAIYIVSRAIRKIGGAYLGGRN
ncbi:MAG: hypothetical protein K2P07_12700 [Lachnospiraceae bacterium]|nr:hypothetical protein [Lachnospiraceae bacterium]